MWKDNNLDQNLDSSPRCFTIHHTLKMQKPIDVTSHSFNNYFVSVTMRQKLQGMR